MEKYFAPLVLLIALGAGCAKQSATSPPSGEDNALKSTPISYYISPNPSEVTKFCNGARMNSPGYKNSLTKGVSTGVPGALSVEERIKTTLSKAVVASWTFDEIYTRTASTTFVDGTVTLHPATGWAGSSIFMCAWQPFAEKQLEQFSEVKKIEWKPVS